MARRSAQRQKNGSHYWDEITIVPIAVNAEIPEYYLALHNDISLRKELVESLKKRAHRQGLLAVLGHSSASAKQLQPLLDQFITVITAELNLNTGMVLQHHTSNNLLLRAACGLNHGEIGKTEINVDKTDFIHYVHDQDEPVIIANVCNDKRFSCNDFIKQCNPVSGIALTLGDRNNPWGVLVTFSDQPTSLQSDDVFFILAITSLLTESIFLHELEAKLKSEKELSKKYLDMANVMFLAINDKEEIIMANQHTARILETDYTSLHGLNWFDNFISEENRSEMRLYFHQIVNQQKNPQTRDSTHTNSVLTLRGNTRLIRWKNTILYDHQQRFICTLSAGEDITDQLRAEQDKERIQQELQQAKKMEAMGHLVGGIAHDFNNILAAILGYTELTMENPVIQANPKLIEYLQEVAKSGHRAKDIVAQLAIFSHHTKNQVQRAYLPTLVKSAIKMLRSAIPPGITLDQSINMDTPTIMIDAAQLNQLIMQCLIFARNGLQQEGGIYIELNTKDLDNQHCSSCQHLLNHNHAQLSVKFTQPGLSASDWQHLLIPQQSDLLPMELQQICKSTHDLAGHILLHGDSTNTQMDILFPLHNPAELPKQSVVAEQKLARIMIVDDENSVAGFLGELLEQSKYQTSVFTDSLSALKSFVSQPHDYDLIITDQVMPALTGFEMAKKMLALRPKLPIILITGHSTQVDADIAHANNIRGFLHKPLQTQVLLEKIRQLLSTS